jgi:hypothetical protein
MLMEKKLQNKPVKTIPRLYDLVQSFSLINDYFDYSVVSFLLHNHPF